jgi:hypothetical protein
VVVSAPYGHLASVPDPTSVGLDPERGAPCGRPRANALVRLDWFLLGHVNKVARYNNKQATLVPVVRGLVPRTTDHGGGQASALRIGHWSAKRHSQLTG